ncbi:hypothetical protein CEXT_423381 [Caerostris extrusa]|uniref:Uncharacterized protein n=1 Tax=Caerostris extrusa TaxID=172846 RepID=A0AAV4XVV3_CAEEX|nr:hypothetical protein CEXT_423381 [Caerostris extrusa]
MKKKKKEKLKSNVRSYEQFRCLQGRDGKIKIKMHDPEPTENVSGIFIRKIHPVETAGNKKLLQDNLHRRLPTLWLNTFVLVFSLFYLRDVKLGVVLFISLRKDITLWIFG